MFQNFTSKPTEIEAVYWDGTDTVADAILAKGCRIQRRSSKPESLKILAGVDGAQGYIDVPVGHYVLCAYTPSKHFYPCDAETFAHHYEPEGATHA